MNNNGKPVNVGKVLVWAVILIMGAVLMSSIFGNQSNDQQVGTMTESALYQKLSNDPKSINKLVFDSGNVHVYVAAHQYDNVATPDETDRSNIRQVVVKYNESQKDHTITLENQSSGGGAGSMLFSLFLSFAPLILMFFLISWMMKGMQGGGGNVMQFGKSKAREVAPSKEITFKDVIGADEAKEDLAEIVYMLRDPAKAKREGIDIPTGVLLEGPPGTGKTLLARAVAGEAGVPFFQMSGSEFVEMFVGVGASRVRDLFTQAKAKGRAIVFIDEIDAVGRKRGSGLGGGHDEREQTLNQILTEMDGFANKGEVGTCVIVIAATNRADVLDPALLRPGRFTRRTVVDLPSVDAREKMFQYYLSKGTVVELHPEVNLRELANVTTGASGADIANAVNEARVFRMRRLQSVDEKVNKDQRLLWEDFDKAISKGLYGPERRSMVITAAVKKTVTVHECGHGTVAYELFGPDAVQKATSIPAGKALGYFRWVQEGDQVLYSEDYCLAHITVAVAGRIAQEYFKEKGYLSGSQRDSGVASDYQQATSLARRMVAEWGMSEKIGIIYAPVHEQQFLGVGSDDTISDSLRQQIEEESKAIIAKCEVRAREIIEKYADRMEVLIAELLERETLSGDQIRTILGAAPTA